ncbi:putative oxidoreductase-like protein [Dinothrombium tinctorium]|uniref:Putative oxidoreductase-like protein n=1 Tax=Dinothrombium tinctorium TaxID=1965070 RepID=A0A443RP81_9ACAR|nr:putative oxidoreductase-like protein [Dinothrombium tinctorium]
MNTKSELCVYDFCPLQVSISKSTLAASLRQATIAETQPSHSASASQFFTSDALYSTCDRCDGCNGHKNDMQTAYFRKVDCDSVLNSIETITLSNGVKLPILGIGTSHSGGYSHTALVFALKHCKYRLIDTAKRYGCEVLLPQAIKESNVEREEIFLTTKLWPKDYGYESTKEALKGSLCRLNTDYIDLFLMHWPEVPAQCSSEKKKLLEDTWRALEVMYDEGLCRAIGVSNYDVSDLCEMFESSSIKPHVNQIEFHPYQNPKSLRNFCDENGIAVQGYCPLGKGKILTEKPIVEIADQVQKSPAQVLIRWAIQNNVSTIPKSTKIHRVFENSNVFDFCLSENQMNVLNNLHDGRRYVDPSSIQKRIDSQLPDGYKLQQSITH